MYLMCFALFSTFILIECTTDFSQPVQPTEYQGVVGQGFSTNYFKTEKPARDYNRQNIQDIYDRGFRNVRLRARADLYDAPYNDAKFEEFLTKLEKVVDDCLDIRVTPIISWIHHDAEARASEQDRKNYVSWWTRVATKLKDKNYQLSFNLFTELGVDECDNPKSCPESLAQNQKKYDDWTSSVVDAIRNTGGNNEERILILTSPQKTFKGLDDINYDDPVLRDDLYLMVEWHDYAAGPNKKYLRSGRPTRRYWSGNGSPEQRRNLKTSMTVANKNRLLSYFGAWMPRDNKEGDLNEAEVISFARFFVSELRAYQIPWSLNVLDDYYDTKNSRWKTGKQDIMIKSKIQQLDMSLVLDNILDALKNGE